MNLDALRSWTKCILIEIREHNEEFHQLPGVDTRRKSGQWGRWQWAEPSLQRDEMHPPWTEVFFAGYLHFIKYLHRLHLQNTCVFFSKLPFYKSVARQANSGPCTHPLLKYSLSNYAIFLERDIFPWTEPSASMTEQSHLHW